MDNERNELKMPAGLGCTRADEIAECYPGITKETYSELWDACNSAQDAGDTQPMGGDGYDRHGNPDGTVETPCVGGYSDEMDAVWPTLSDDAKRNIIAADLKEHGPLTQ